MDKNNQNEKNIGQEVAFIAPLQTKIPDLVSQDEGPFAKDSFSTIFKRRILTEIGKALEVILGTKLFTKAFGDELDYVDSKLKKLIYRLLNENIIGSFRFMLPPPNWPKVIYASFSLKPIKLPSGAMRQLGGTVGGGCALDYNTATRKALAEVLERYSLCTYNPKNFILGSFQELKNRNAVDPRKFTCFSIRQLENPEYRKHHYFDDETKFNWVEAQSLFDSRKYLVPAQLVYLFYEQGEGEPIIRQTTTNGAAAGSSWEMAAYNAVCEAIERDAFMICWLNQLVPPKIDLTNIKNSVLKAILYQCQRYGVNITVFDITTDVEIPTVLAVLLQPDNGRDAVRISPRTDLDVEKAIMDAVVDGLKIGAVNNVSTDEIQKANSIAPQLRTIEQRRAFWADHERIKDKDIEFLFNGPEKMLTVNKFIGATYSKKLKEIKRIFRAKNFETFFVDATSPAAKEAGLSVLMSLIPKLYPLYLNEHFKYLAIPRLYEAPVHMGILETHKKEEEMNSFPHPML